ncbi:hypothetical protein FMUAM8_34420 [Nocardia cyriacigeorgica]|nr:hypothetical protein FMUAM8_34420 [Nocardia cyriacigeorgica]BDU07073.1 hypothetical protein FMUBM48_33360 [Nocardia cyriacigeorgica]
MGVAQEQLAAHFAFELGDMPAHRRLTQPELTGGGGEPTVLLDRDKATQQNRIEHQHLAIVIRNS